MIAAATEPLLGILKYVLLALLYVFFARVLWRYGVRSAGHVKLSGHRPVRLRRTTPPSLHRRR